MVCGLLAFALPVVALQAQATPAEGLVALPSPTEADQPLDPQSPLAPLPDLGVEWPDLSVDPVADIPVDETVVAAPQDDGGERKYAITIDGIDALDASMIRTRFKALSVLEEDSDKKANSAQIERRIREDERLLADLLRAEGYYDAQINSRVEATGDTIAITFTIRPGDLYRFTTVDVVGLDAAGDKASNLRQAFDIDDNDPVDAAKVLAAEAMLREQIAQMGFPFARVEEPIVTIDHEARTATLRLAVEPGTAAKFGRIRLADDSIMDAKHIQDIARFDPGDPFDQRDVDDLRQALVQTGLVSSVRLETVPGTVPETVDLDIALTPAPVRTIAGAFGYDTGEGFRVEASWQHRNLFKPEGAVIFRGIVGTREQLASATFRRNNFQGRDKVLTAGLSVSNTRFDAYRARTLQLNAGIERLTNIFFQKKWTWFFGAELLATNERDIVARLPGSSRRTFFIAAAPTGVTYDDTDDLLNPARGFRLGARISPEASLESGFFAYARGQIDGSYYYPVNDTVTLATRARLGTIIGSSATRIAPSRRFYAGGGASVRGYSYQGIGPRDLNNDPVGGRSLLELSGEARIRTGLLGGNLGIVPFIDAGNIDTGPLPKLRDLRVGAGLGIRYFTSFGPIRVDVGTPLNPQRGDPRVAVYVSLGQAF